MQLRRRRLPLWRASNSCGRCGLEFNALAWRHHCRVCGVSMCAWRCPWQTLEVPFCSEPVAVCAGCAANETPDTLASLACAEPRPTDAQLKAWQQECLTRCQVGAVTSVALAALVRAGVPSGLRATVWPVLLRTALCPANQPATQSPAAKELMVHDAPRTFPDDVHLDRDLLRCALGVLPLEYQQGMSLVAAVLLLHVEPPDVPRCMAVLLTDPRYGLGAMYARADCGGGSEADVQPPVWLAAFSSVFEALLPRVVRFLYAAGVDPSVVVLKWLRSAFADVLPRDDVLLRIWDLYFCHGVDFLFRVTVALFSFVEDDVLACQPAQLLRLLNELPARAMAVIPSSDALVERSLALKG